MTENKSILSDHALETFFEQARSERIDPSPEFMARLLYDMETMQDTVVQDTVIISNTKKGWLKEFWNMTGGWFGSGSFATALVLGVWLGSVQPSGLESLTDMFWGEFENVSVFATSPDLWEDG